MSVKDIQRQVIRVKEKLGDSTRLSHEQWLNIIENDLPVPDSYEPDPEWIKEIEAGLP